MIGVRRTIRWAWRSVSLCVGVLVLYVLVTFAQVWDASTQDQDDPADAIVVLGAAQYNGVPSPVLARRLDHALELYEAGVAPTIVVTGGKQAADRFTEAAASFTYLRERGVPESAILREENGANTWDQLAATSRLLADRNVSSAVLVSDDYHALRLDMIAGEVGLDATVSPVDQHLSAAGKVRALVRETAAVSVGRVIAFRRLSNLR